MATLKHAESRRRYSWWWDSHISPKNSKWLQENLTDMDAKVKIMIKLIEADADTFARRAEMYYKKRPELMKLVEESYRAYRALAERYDHATGALRQAHRTMAEAFPNQVPFTDEPHTTEMPEAMQDLMFGPKEDNKERGVQNGVSGQNQVGSEYEGVGKAEDEVQILKKAIEKLEAEKEASLVQYQQSLEKLSNLETELLHAQKGASELNERATKAENEADSLKHALSKLEAEKEAGIANYVHSLERISDLETKISRAQEEVRGLNDRASIAETEVQTLKQALTKLEAENEAFLLRYKQCLEMISDLENKLSFAEAEARRHSERGDKSEAEVHSLKEIIANLNEAKEAAILQYQQCLETISDLGTKITRAEEETTRLNNEVEIGVEKYKSAEEQHHLLEREYQSLQLEANTLMQKMGILITHELVEKDEELVNLKARMQEEHLHLIQAQEALIRLQDLHYKSQEEQRALELELENRFQMLEEMKFQNQLLEDEIQQLKEQNENLNKQNLSSTVSIKNLQGEILSLKEAIEKFKEEVELRLDQRNALQQEIYCLKEEINELNRRHKGFIDQVESVGFKPNSFGLSVKNLKNERSMLREIYQNEREEKQSLLQKLEHMEKLLQTNALLENSLSNVNVELEEVREKLKALEETCKSLQQEKSALAAEKAILVSQLKIVTENRDKLSEKNKLLENSLTEVNVELQGSRTTSKILEESFKAVKNENSDLMTERNSLVTKLESIQQRVKILENCYTELSEKHLYLEKAKDLTLDQVAGLRASVNLDKQEHASFVHSNETHMANLENKIFVLQEEHRSMKKEFDEKQEKAMKAQMEFFIWEKSIRDVEERNMSLLIENQKHVEESRSSEKLIMELEQKNLQGEMNVKYLSNQVNKLRTTIYQVFKSLGNDLDYDYQGNTEEDERLLQHIITKIENTDNLVVEIQNEKQQLLFEKSVLIALLEKLTSDLQETHLGLQSENFKLIQENRSLTNEFSNLKERNSILEKETNVMIEEIMVLSNLCLMLKSFRAEKAEELEEFGEGMEYLHGVNGGLEKEIRIIREGMDKLENELKIFKGENDQLNHQIEIGAELLSQKEMELTHAQEKLNTMESKSMEAQMKIEEYKTREESLGSQLEEKRNDVEFWEAEAEKLYRDRQISAIHEVIFKEKTYELLGARDNHEDKSGTHIAEIEQLRECLCVLEGENEGMKFEMAKYANDLIPLVESIKSLEELVFSEIIIPIADNHKTEDAELTNHRGDKSTEECHLEVSDGIPDLHDLQTRLQAVEKALREIKKLKMQGNSETGLKSKTSMKGAKESKTHLVRREEKPGKDIVGKPIEMELQTKNSYRETPKAEPEISIVKNKVLVKDIMLDQVAESSSYDKEFDPYSRSGRRSARKDDQFMELWEFVEKDRSINLKVNTRKSRSGRRGNSIDYQEGRKSAYSNSSVSLEDKELVIDKLEVSKSVSKAEQEGNAQKILERLSSDSKKLSNLNITVQGLKRKLEQTSKPKRADNFEYDMVDGQLQEIDEAILQLLEINGKLRKNLEVPLSRNGKAEMESEESKNVRRRKVTEQAERVSERIGRLLLEVQRIQFVLLKLDDEHEPAGTSSIAERRRRVLLRDYFYGNRRSFRTRRRKRDRLCACVRPSTVEED